MSKSQSQSLSLKPIINVLREYIIVIVVTVTVLTLIYVVFMLNGIIDESDGSDSSSQNRINNTAVFDQATIDRLNKLKTSDSNSSYKTLPSGRIDPFSE